MILHDGKAFGCATMVFRLKDIQTRGDNYL